jgi:putative transposase
MTTAFNELHPIIGVAPACAALAINRAEIYRDRERLVKIGEIRMPRSHRPRPPLALSEAERTTLLLILDSERFCDLAPAAVPSAPCIAS